MTTEQKLDTRTSYMLRTFRAFKVRNYRVLWISGLLHQVARWMQLTIISWLVFELTDSPFRVALAGFFTWMPMLVFGLLGGLVSDSVNRAKLLRSSQGISAVSALVIMVLLWSDLIEVWHTYAAVLVTGLGMAFDQPTRRSLVHDLLGDRGVTNGLALDSLSFSSSKVIGPAVAGVIIASTGVALAYTIVCVLFISGTLLVWFVTVVQECHATWKVGEIKSELLVGIREAWTHTVVRSVVVVTLVMNLFMFPYIQMVPVIARDVLGVGPGLMGIMIALDGLGTFMGSLILASVRKVNCHGLVFIFGSVLALSALVALSFSRFYVLSMGAMIVLGIGTAGFGTMQGAIVVLVARREMRGRILGVVALAIGASPFGSLLVGAIASGMGAPVALGLNGIFGIVLVGLVAVFASQLRGRTVVQEDV